MNMPNTAAGIALGTVGQIAGKLKGNDSRVSVTGRRVEFFNNPAARLGALTLGNVTMYGDDPYNPTNRNWDNLEKRERHSVQAHEDQHARQGEQLGSLYLGSNLLGGALALIRDRDGKGRPDWHGPSNWNERGPQMNPARPWAPKVWP